MTPVLICVAAACAMINALPQFDVVRAQRLAMPMMKELSLADDCEQMNSYGRIQDVLRDLGRNAQELASIRIEHKPELYQERIHELRSEIHKSVVAAKEILRPEWSDNKWPFEASWYLRFEDFMEADEKIIDEAFGFSNFELEGIELAGVEREDLYPLIDVNVSKSQISIHLNKKASTLELCQLQGTLIVSGKTKYRFQNRLVTKQTELMLRPGAVHIPTIPVIPPRHPMREPQIDIDDIRCRLLGQCGPLFPWNPSAPPRPGPMPFPGGPR